MEEKNNIIKVESFVPMGEETRLLEIGNLAFNLIKQQLIEKTISSQNLSIIIKHFFDMHLNNERLKAIRLNNELTEVEIESKIQSLRLHETIEEVFEALRSYNGN